MTPEDAQAVAQTAAKAANLGVAAHEKAFHAEGDQAQAMAAVPAGFLDARPGEKSSKRLESFIGLGAAILMAVLTLALKNPTVNAVGPGLTVAFLSYSAAMQGVSAFAERGLP